jgi:uncharacterized OsmC-like protein
MIVEFCLAHKRMIIKHLSIFIKISKNTGLPFLKKGINLHNQLKNKRYEISKIERIRIDNGSFCSILR